MKPYLSYTVLLVFLPTTLFGQPEEQSEACKKALEECENDLECQNRLAPLMAACTTGTCQPQCRNAVLNVYQNKLGRALLRSDATCIPGREELKTCHFLPLGSVLHCSLAKLACEADLQCNSKWSMFVSECESESVRGECSPKCNQLLADTLATTQGAPLGNCTCTEREDQLCQRLRDNLLAACTKGTPPPPTIDGNSIIDQDSPKAAFGINTNFIISSFMLIICLRAIF